MSAPRDDEDPRDAHLLAALRHAPDRDALPPREVSVRILAAARAAVRPAPWWTRVGAWLMQPQVAGAFGTLAVASLVGILWSTREPPVVEPALPEAMREQSAPSAAAGQSTSAAVAMAGSAAPSEPERDLFAQTIPPTPAPKPEAAPRRTQEAKARAESRRRAEVLADKAAAPSAEVAAAPAPQAADAPAAPSASESSSNNTAAVGRVARRDAASSGPASAAAPVAEALTLAAKADNTGDPLAQFDPLLARGNATWSNNGGRALAHGAVQADWWAQLRRATGGAWQRLPPAAPDIVSVPRLPWLTLAQAGVPKASIDLGSDSVQLCLIEQHACWRAPISSAQREAWIAEVARW